jgi:hypothetical protein
LRLAAWPGEFSALAFDAENGRTHLVSAQAHQLLAELLAAPDLECAVPHAPDELLAGLVQARLLVAAAAD